MGRDLPSGLQIRVSKPVPVAARRDDCQPRGGRGQNDLPQKEVLCKCGLAAPASLSILATTLAGPQ
eukprot:5842037-Amphidinium_carterae.1